jgi:hypothetical protein
MRLSSFSHRRVKELLRTSSRLFSDLFSRCSTQTAPSALAPAPVLARANYAWRITASRSTFIRQLGGGRTSPGRAA